MSVPVIGALITQFHRQFVDDAFSQVRIGHVELSETDRIAVAASDLGQPGFSVEGIIPDQNSGEVWSEGPADVFDLVLGGNAVVVDHGVGLSGLSKLCETDVPLGHPLE